MSLLSSDDRENIIRRRGCRSDGDGKVHRISNLEIHHKDRFLSAASSLIG